MPSAPAAAPMAGTVLGAPMWQQWPAPNAGAGTWGPMGGVPVNGSGPAPAAEKTMFSGGSSMLSGGSNFSTATLLGKRSVPAS